MFNNGRFSDSAYSDSWNTQAYETSPRRARHRRDYYGSRNTVYNDYNNHSTPSTSSGYSAYGERYDGRNQRSPYIDAYSLPYEDNDYTLGDTRYHERHSSREYNRCYTHPGNSRTLSTYTDDQYTHSRPSGTPPPPPIPDGPSPEYLEIAAQTSSTSETPPRKLVILDLNGTLLVRVNRGVPYPRPYMPTFRDYLLSPKTREWLDTMVWSSAQSQNVEKMVRRCFFDPRLDKHSQEEDDNYDAHSEDTKYKSRDYVANKHSAFKDIWSGKLSAVWARDTLGLSRNDYSRKSRTTKDLSKVWAALPEDHSALTSFLLDDSPAKVRLQPFNHVCISEYGIGNRDQDMALKRIREAQELDDIKKSQHDADIPENISGPSGLVGEECNPTVEHDNADLEATQNTEIDQRLQRRKDKKMRKRLEREMRRQRQKLESSEGKTRTDNNILSKQIFVDDQNPFITPAGFGTSGAEEQLQQQEYDQTLLAIIGILEAIKNETNVAGWIRSGGLWANKTPPPSTILDQYQDQDQDLVLDTGIIPLLERAPSPTDAEVEDLAENPPISSSPTPSPILKRTRPEALEIDPEIPRSPIKKPKFDTTERFPSLLERIEGVPVPLELSPSTPKTAPQVETGPELETEVTTTAPGNDAQTKVFDNTPLDIPTSPVLETSSTAKAKAKQDPTKLYTSSPAAMWFEDEETFDYWVSKGRSALKDLEIEERDGICLF